MTALDFYQLEEQPFGVTSDARFLFLTATQKEALSSLIYGIESGCGFVALIAPPGLGKTTLLHQALHILREKARLVFLFQTICTPLDLLRALLSGLGVQDLSGSLVEMQIKLKNLLAEQYRGGKRVVLVIDEAQNLDEPVLELVRMLSNFETTTDKLIQIVLAGQPQLAENIGSPQLVQLRQRVSIFARLQPLTLEETTQYILHRLAVAGYRLDRPLFTRDALALIAQSSEGIPRNINNLCFNALSLGCALNQKPIDRDILQQVIADLDLGPLRVKVARPVSQEDKRVVTLKANPAYASPKRTPAAQASWMPKAAFGLSAVLAIAAVLFMAQQWLVRTPAAPPVREVAASPAPVSEPVTAVASGPAVSAMVETPSSPVEPVNMATVDTPAPPVPTGTVSSPDVRAQLAAEIASLEGERAPQASEAPDLVSVAPGQTLLGICEQKFGSCSAQILRQIHDLNPSIRDLDHIETGQKLKIPVLAAISALPRPSP